MERRTFLQIAASATGASALAKPPDALPSYRIVSKYKAEGHGMPGRYPGQVAVVHSDRCIDASSEKVDAVVVAAMMEQGMTALTGHKDLRDAWATFLSPSDMVGIKVNCSGAPNIMSSPEVVAQIVKNVVAVGVPPSNIFIYERFPDQMDSVHYDRYVPAGVNIRAAEQFRGSILAYDPKTYVEVNFFGEEDTRSNMIRLIPEKFTKIINVPNMKDHQAAGVTGCLKNIAYGSFSNVARSHYREKTNTYSFIGTLASVEPLRSRTVLHVMDGLRGVWHGGPFSTNRKFRFYPKQMMFGTDPVSIDRLLIDVIESKRNAEGAVSVWNRSMEHISQNPGANTNLNRFVRETGHIEYASKLGLGEYDIGKIQKKTINL